MHEPWASLIACGIKRYETRSWERDYRGELAIHATRRRDWIDHIRLFPEHTDITYSPGCVVAVAELVAIHPSAELIRRPTFDIGQLRYGDFTTGRWIWELRNVRRIEPVVVRGNMGLWELPRDVEDQIRAQNGEPAPE